MSFGRFRDWFPIRATILISICTLGSLCAQAVSTNVQFMHQLWQAEEGLPGQLVRAVTQTHDGYLWIITSETLARFDGLRFTASDRKIFDRDRYYAVLTETSDGSLWTATTSGLARTKNGESTFYSATNGLPCSSVLTVYQDRQGTIWIGSTNGLAKFEDGKFIRFTSKEGFVENSVRAILQDRSGTLWVGTIEGLIEYRDGHTTYHTQTNFFHNSVQTLCETRDGSLWVGTADGLDRYRNGVCTTYVEKEGELNRGTVRALFEDDSGLWIGTAGGLQRFVNERFERVNTTGNWAADFDHTVPGYVYSICRDQEGDIWVGTSVGLNRLKRQNFFDYRKEDGLPDRQANSVLQDRNGDFWIGTPGGLARIHDEQIRTWGVKDGFSTNHILALAEARAGGLWVGTEAGLDRFSNEKVTQHFTSDQSTNLANDAIRVLLEDSRQRLWIGGDNGLSCYQNGSFLPPERQFYQIKTILEDRQGNIWVGSRRGLARINDAGVKLFGKADRFVPETVNALYEDKAGTLWIGTEHGDLLRLKNGHFDAFPPTHAKLNGILHIADDDAGNLWISTLGGIFRLSKAELEAFAVNPANSARNITFGKLEGMRRAQCNSLAQPAGWKARDGQLWFPTLTGVVAVDVNQIRPNKIVPNVIIEQALARGHPIQLENGSAVLAPSSEVEFAYTALSLALPERNLFQCRLQGADTKWQDQGTKRSVRYANLPPGDYVFQVRACNNEGLWNLTGTSFAFTIEPHFYQTASFLGLCLAAAGFGGIAISRLRLRQLRLRELELTRLVDEKTKSLVESQQMVLRQERLAAVGQLAAGVAHEFNNILTIIQGHAALLMEDPKLDVESIKSLRHICNGVDRTAKLTQQILAFSRKQVMQQQVLDLNDAVTHIGQMLGRLLEDNIKVRCDFATHLPTIEADPGMVEQIVMNLAVNARDAMPKGGQLTIGTKAVAFNQAEALLRAERHPGNFVQLSVTDTGSGMDAATVNRLFEPFFTTKEVGKGTGLGLATVYGIVQQHHGWIEVDSAVGKGTTFRIYFPASEKPAEESHEIPAQPDVSGGYETVLVVEDEPVLRELVREILESQGYRILEASNGVEALRLWERERRRIDLLLTDIIMPEGVSGRELAARLRSDNPNLPIIFSSGHSQEMVERTVELGKGASYLSKPYHPDQLSKAVRESLDAAKAAKTTRAEPAEVAMRS